MSLCTAALGCSVRSLCTNRALAVGMQLDWSTAVSTVWQAAPVALLVLQLHTAIDQLHVHS